jgi:hypothetical protein
MASFLQLSKNDVPNCFETLRSRRSRQSRKNGVAGNKKPGVKRRAIPSTHPVGRICSKLDCCLSGVRNQPHLYFEGEITGPSGPPSAPLGLPTSEKYTDFLVFVKRHSHYFRRVPVNFTWQCGNRKVCYAGRACKETPKTLLLKDSPTALTLPVFEKFHLAEALFGLRL